MSDPVSVSRRLVAVFAADVEGYNRDFFLNKPPGARHGDVP
jgi:hypothetical protein